MKPPFNYFGAKTTLGSEIAALFPSHRHYVEPFGGSLAVLLAKPPAPMETVNDLDSRLMTFWRVLRERPDELERLCALTPHSRAEYAAAYEPCDDELESARRVWVILSQGRGGQILTTGWRYEQDPRDGRSSSTPIRLASYVSRIAPCAARIAGVTLECRPALEVIRDYGRHPGVLIYADPPYPSSVRPATARYGCEMPGDDSHRELLEALLGCRAAVVLSGYAAPLYDDLLAAWSRREIATRTGNGAEGQGRTEVLWSNRPFPRQGTLFDTEAS